MSSTPPPPSERDRRQAARDHAAALRVAEQRRRRRRRGALLAAIGAAVVLAVVVVVVLAFAVPRSSSDAAGPSIAPSAASGTLGPEGMAVESGAVLASNTTGSSGATRDGIGCSASEGAVEHIHTHLAVYVDGVLRPIPVGIGVVDPAVQDGGTADAFAEATRCYYWLHVHAEDGVIHVEAPAKRTYTLGQLFAVWAQPLSTTTVAGATGTQTIYVDGKRVTGDPADIALGSREDIQIDVGRAVPYRQVDWSRSRL